MRKTSNPSSSGRNWTPAALIASPVAWFCPIGVNNFPVAGQAGFYATQPNVRKVIVISNYARAWTVGSHEIASGKIVVLEHGVQPEECANMASDPKSDVSLAAAARDPYRVVYTSSWDRGLEKLIDVWPQVYRAVGPRASLVITYGRGPIGQAYHERLHEMQLSMNTELRYNLTDHDVSVVYASAGVWAYPCAGVELFCTSAVRAQCNGAVPVVIPCMALQDTVKFGIKTTPAHFADELASMLHHPQRQELIRADLQRYRFATWRELTETMRSWFDSKHTVTEPCKDGQDCHQGDGGSHEAQPLSAGFDEVLRWRKRYRDPQHDLEHHPKCAAELVALTAGVALAVTTGIAYLRRTGRLAVALPFAASGSAVLQNRQI